MITFKCKMCGGDLHPDENATTCECEYCGSVQTVPTADNEKKMNLIARAQRLLRACESIKLREYMSPLLRSSQGKQRPTGAWCCVSMASSMLTILLRGRRCRPAIDPALIA